MAIVHSVIKWLPPRTMVSNLHQPLQPEVLTGTAHHHHGPATVDC